MNIKRHLKQIARFKVYSCFCDTHRMGNCLVHVVSDEYIHSYSVKWTFSTQRCQCFSSSAVSVTV